MEGKQGINMARLCRWVLCFRSMWNLCQVVSINKVSYYLIVVDDSRLSLQQGSDSSFPEWQNSDTSAADGSYTDDEPQYSLSILVKICFSEAELFVLLSEQSVLNS
jgi:hypothetical protein